MKDFTRGELDWRPWVDPLDITTATQEQLAALKITPSNRAVGVYSLVLAPIGASPWLLGYAGWLFGVISVLGGAAMVALALRLCAADTKPAAERVAKQLFAFSIVYLFVLFAALLVERAIGIQGVGAPFGRVFA